MKIFSVVCVLNLYCSTLALSQTPDYRKFEIQAPEKQFVDASYITTNPLKTPIVTLPMQCLSRFIVPNALCKSDAGTDLALEKEYWRYIATEDTIGMQKWLHKKAVYLWNSKSPNAGRFEMLSIFGNLQVYSKNPEIFNLLSSPSVLSAFSSSINANKILPRSPNAQAFQWALVNFTDFALGLENSALKAAQKMIDLKQIYGDHGLAGPIGAVAHLMGAKNKLIVQQGVDYFNQCFDQGYCKLETSIAPFQVIGTRITQAEAYAYLGDIDAMDRSFQDAQTLANERNWPLKHMISEWRNDVIKTGGLRDQWKSAEKKLGGIRQPLGVAHRITACAMCHIGNSVPDYYHIETEK